MAPKRITNKQNKVVKRFRTRQSVQANVNQKDQDILLIDLVLEKLYNNGDKQTASLTEEILKPNNIPYTEKGSGRLWDILISTGLVNSIVGFGRAGRLALTNDGYQLMRNFGSYSNFIQQREQQAKAPQQSGIVIPKFILAQKSDAAADKKAAEAAPQEKQLKSGEENENAAAATEGETK